MTLFDTLNVMTEIRPNEVYTTNEAQTLLRVSNSTIKRLLKNGILRANKVGGQYRIMGKEILRVISPTVERKAVNLYQKLRKKVKNKVRTW